jgi:antitoxin (DNA-binding transcriptional repressor) of toxin-antitoxin stability system
MSGCPGYNQPEAGVEVISVAVGEAQANLPELLDRLLPGEVMLITRQDQPVAQSSPRDPSRFPAGVREC